MNPKGFGSRYTCPGCSGHIQPGQPRKILGTFLIHTGCEATCSLCGETVEHVPFGGNDVSAWLGSPVHTACKKGVQ